MCKKVKSVSRQSTWQQDLTPTKGQVALSVGDEPRIRCQINGAFSNNVRLQVL